MKADSNAAAIAVQQLFAQVQTAVTDQRTRESLVQEKRNIESESQAAVRERDRTLAELQQLCEEAGCDSPEELPKLESLSRQRHRVQNELQSLERQLRAWCRSDDFESFLTEAEAVDPEQNRIESAQLQLAIEEHESEQAAALEQLGGLKNRLRQMDGSGHAADLAQSMQDLTGRLDADMRRYVSLTVEKMLLEDAVENYRRTHQNPVLEKAEAFFRRLTHGRYEGLIADVDAKGRTLLHVRPAGEVGDFSATSLSTGAADALYLSLRLASLEHQLSAGTGFPLIVDDCLVQLDDRRTAEALKLFAELSTRTQVIVFTHHQGLLDIAKAELNPDHYFEHQLGSAASV